MICAKNIHRTTKYFLLILLIHCHLCFAQDDAELTMESHEGLSLKPSSRRLLYDSYSSSSMNGTELAVYIIAVVIITIISVCCKYCIKTGCEPSAEDYSDAVVHAPPRSRNPTVPVVSSSGRRALNPPRSSGRIILPPEDGIFSVDFTGIENPNYYPSMYVPPPNYYPPTSPQFSTNDASHENPTPILDLPPSYETVIREQKFPKVN